MVRRFAHGLRRGLQCYAAARLMSAARHSGTSEEVPGYEACFRQIAARERCATQKADSTRPEGGPENRLKRGSQSDRAFTAPQQA